MGTESLVIYYDDEELDLKGLIQELAGMRGSRYHQRSMSAIGRMVLHEALEQELENAEKDVNSSV
ncbi:MAG: hypothetical protein ACE5LU_16015 [Anaerolineae bacterium]